MSQSAKVTLDIQVSQSGGGALNTAVSTINVVQALNLLNGAGANQSNQAWSDDRQLAASAVDSHDLAGSLADAFGSTITFTSITAIAVIADAGNGDNIEIGGNANAMAGFVGGATEIVKVPPGGMFLITAPDATGFAVTAGTGDILDITNADAGAVADYKIVIIGRE